MRHYLGKTTVLSTGLATLFVGACQTSGEIALRLDRSPAELVSQTPGLVAFWDFDADEDGRMRSVSDPSTPQNRFEMLLRRIGDPVGYSFDKWPYGASDSRAELVHDASGPFGHALRLDTGHLYAETPRSEFEGTDLDLTGRKPFTLIAWVKFTGKRHMIAGIWDEGGWDRYAGRRQVALFGGLFNQKGVIAHISETGAASFPQSDADGAQYARRRAIDGQPFDNGEWITAAMTFDPANSEVVAWLNGRMVDYSVMDPVEQDALGLTSSPPSNPYRFAQSIFSPHRPTIKFNGYDWETTGVTEHRLLMDLERGQAVYERDTLRPVEDWFRVIMTTHVGNGADLQATKLDHARSGDRIAIPMPEGGLHAGDKVTAQLSRFVDGGWRPVGSAVTYRLREGAPFTVGRALGLGEGTEKIEEGSQMFVDGVAVFDRVLTTRELRELAFDLGG